MTPSKQHLHLLLVVDSFQKFWESNLKTLIQLFLPQAREKQTNKYCYLYSLHIFMCYIHSKTLRCLYFESRFPTQGTKHTSHCFQGFLYSTSNQRVHLLEEYDLKIRNNHIDIYLISIVKIKCNSITSMVYAHSWCSALQIISVCSGKN